MKKVLNCVFRVRSEKLDRCRALFNANEGETLDKFQDATQDNSIDIVDLAPSSQRASKKRSEFSDILMHSEWLIDIPGDISTEWFMLPVPVGKRCLVVAQQVYFKHLYLSILGTNCHL